jgi:predicted transcriptional regulator
MLADLSEKPLRFHESFSVRIDKETLQAIESLAARLGSTRGAVARRLLHLGLAQALIKDEAET